MTSGTPAASLRQPRSGCRPRCDVEGPCSRAATEAAPGDGGGGRPRRGAAVRHASGRGRVAAARSSGRGAGASRTPRADLEALDLLPGDAADAQAVADLEALGAGDDPGPQRPRPRAARGSRSSREQTTAEPAQRRIEHQQRGPRRGRSARSCRVRGRTRASDLRSDRLDPSHARRAVRASSHARMAAASPAPPTSPRATAAPRPARCCAPSG